MLLGDFPLCFTPFSTIDKALKSLQAKSFTTLSARKKFDGVNATLLNCIHAETEPCFLLPAVIDYIAKINEKKLLQEPYRMVQFEFWLNHYSNLSADENRIIRNKIVGKNISRDDYQLFFPIGMNKTLTGSHFVAAHASPDVDTTIASFWGWVDAFGARVGTGIHHWVLPGAVADSHINMLFEKLFSKNIFDVLVRQTPTLSLTAQDLVCSKDVLKLHVNEHLSHIHIGRHIVAIDNKGYFKGDWRPSDAVAVNQVISAFYSLIRWLEHGIYYNLISAYAKQKVVKKDIQKALKLLFTTKLCDSEPAKEFNSAQKTQVDTFIKAVLKIPKGSKATYQQLVASLAKTADISLPSYQFAPDAIFNDNGTLIENRPQIFSHLEVLFRSCADASSASRKFLERLDVLLATKTYVLGIPSQFITLKSDVDEIRTKMNNLEYLTVVIPEDDNWFPVGVVYANDIKRNPLGTVSLRDFSNETETKMASYLEVVSIIDHHKSDIKTSNAATIIVGDAQSANTIVAEQVLKLNKRYSLLGMTPKEITKQKKAHLTSLSTPSDFKKLKRLLELSLNAQHASSSYIHPMREYSEYLFFLHAILDDTDLLTKVSNRDLEIVAELLNRMKSITSKQDCELITFDDLAKDGKFTTSASMRILKDRDMYSIYQKIYAHKEKEVETNLSACIKGQASTIFSDTKEQNGCSRIGQTKLFSTNFSSFCQHADQLRKLWLEQAKKVYERTSQIDLHMQMVTTVATADEVYTSKTGNWSHQDELWIWVPPIQGAIEHLVNFLNSFSETKLIEQNELEVEFLGENFKDLELIFSQNFPKAHRTTHKEKGLPIAVLRFKAGLLNSRKAFITPYLPSSIT